MNKVIFTVVSLLIASQSAFAANNCSSSTPADRACRREFAHDVIKCVMTSFFMKPKTRAANLRNCVTVAKDERNKCLNPVTGPSQCELSCQAQYDLNVATCNANNDPAVCGGNASCEQFYLQERATCVSAATDALGACNAACPQ